MQGPADKLVDDAGDCLRSTNQALSILTIIEDHHFTFIGTKPPCIDELERIAALISLVADNLFGVRSRLEKMAGYKISPLLTDWDKYQLEKARGSGCLRRE